MVTLLRILAILSAFEAVGNMMVTSQIERPGEGVFTWLGRVLGSGFPALQLALVTFVVANLVVSKNIQNKTES
jgi:hypothetical protein